MLNENGVVYHLKCKNCDATYVGETKRQLSVRIEEHKKKLDSVISEHCMENNHFFDFAGVSVLDREKNWNRRRISEMLHIKLQNNAINKQIDTKNLSEIYSNFISNCKQWMLSARNLSRHGSWCHKEFRMYISLLLVMV